MEGLLLLCLVLALYFVPAIVASNRRHHNFNAIALLNLFLGWTLLGWVAALVWACTEVRKRPAAGAEKPERTKKCPFCAEWIRQEAIRCRYCGSDLTTARPDHRLSG